MLRSFKRWFAGQRSNAEYTAVPGAHRGRITSLYWFLLSLRDPAQIVLSAVSAGCWAVAGLIGGQEIWNGANWLWPVGGAVSAALVLFGTIFFFKPSYKDLAISKAKAEKDSEEFRAALQGAVDQLIIQLHDYICGDVVDCRVSVYSVEEDEFVLLGRYSQNPNLERRGRPSYPLDQGTIGKAWAKQFAIENDPEPDRQKWEAGLGDRGFSASEAAALTMHSRSVYAQRLDRGSEKVGVLVFECEAQERFTLNAFRKVDKSHLAKALAEITRASHVHLPRVQERLEERQNRQPLVVVPEPAWKQSVLSVGAADLERA